MWLIGVFVCEVIIFTLVVKIVFFECLFEWGDENLFFVEMEFYGEGGFGGYVWVGECGDVVFDFGAKVVVDE